MVQACSNKKPFKIITTYQFLERNLIKHCITFSFLNYPHKKIKLKNKLTPYNLEIITNYHNKK